MQLGKLKEIDIRKVWQHEQYDFSKWLSSENNLKELGDILNLSLTDVETEKFVGNYRCDILCKDEITSKIVFWRNNIKWNSLLIYRLPQKKPDGCRHIQPQRIK